MQGQALQLRPLIAAPSGMYTKPCRLKVLRRARQPRATQHCLRSGVPRQRQETAGERQGVGVGGCAARASTKLRIMLRRLWIWMSVLLSSLTPVDGEVSLVRSHSVMASRS